jgi:tetratricopeptide (TPR) repeat protein
MTGLSQQTVLYQHADRDFQQLIKEYEEGLYGRCIRSAQRYRDVYKEARYEPFQIEADLYALRSGLMMNDPGVLDRIFAFSERHQPDPVSEQALLLIGEDAYNRKEYEDAIKYLSMVDGSVLPTAEQSALYFKLGYVLFVKKEFDRAADLFAACKDNRDKYYYPANYYYGMTQYFKGNYPEAIRSFEKVAPSSYYKDYIPYYITQIYFSTKEYTKVIGYGTQSLNTSTVLNKTEIRQLIGQAYFETGDYAAAIPHLEYVEKESDKLRTDDFYQLGMACYHTGKYKEAIPVLLQIRNESGVKAQYANYYLGQCYLKTGDDVSARNSLKNASQMQDVPSLAVESAFHYGRLSAEAGDDTEAINVLQTIPSSSPHYTEAQTTLAGILINTSDYQLAIEHLEAMKSLSPALKEAYQKVCLYRAEQLIQEGKIADAALLLDKSLQQPVDKGIEARAYFWKGELAHHAKQYNESIKWFNQFFAAAEKAQDLPIHQQVPMGQYTQGYNYLKNENYTEAQNMFERAEKGLSALPVSSPLIQKQIYPDVLLRAGDCAFKRNQLDKALGYYDQSISKKQPGHDYAIYQKAVIKGLQKKPTEKITLLQDLVKNDADSRWADDALFQLGNTFQDEGQSAKAIQAYEQIVKDYGQQSPLLQPALLRLGLISYNSGQHEKALVYYKQVYSYNPDPETSREAMAAIQEIYVNELEKPDEYFAFAETVPGFSVSGGQKDTILYNAAENIYALGQYDKAAESFQKYIATYPDGLYTLKAKYLRAECFSLLKKYDDALAGYETVIDVGPGAYYAPALYKAALIAYNQQQDMARAFSHYQKYIPIAETEEKGFEATMGALRCAYKLNATQEVYHLSNQVIGHARATDDSRSWAHYYTGLTAYRTQSLDTALQACNAVIKLNSAALAAECRYIIASVYHQKGENDIALRLAESSAKANVGYPFWVAKSLLLLSDIQLANGDLLNARAVLEAITENFQGDEVIMKEATEKLDRVKKEEEIQSRIKPQTGDTLELQQPSKNE